MQIRIALLTALAVSSASAAPPPLPLSSVFLRIPSNSMQPSLPQGSLLVAEQVVEPLSKGAIVLATSPSGTPLALRVAGLPGDRIQLDNGHVIVNGEIIRNEGADVPAQRIGFARYPKWNETYIVPPGSFYLVADNRVEGIDSIELGAFERATVKGQLALWSVALEQRGRVQTALTRAFAPVHDRLPLTVGDGWTLRNIEVPEDTLLRVTYTVDLEPSRALRSLSAESLETELRVGYCRNRLLQLAAGLSVEYVIQSKASSIRVLFQQAKCQGSKSDA